MDELIVAVILGVVLCAGVLVLVSIGAWVRVGNLERRVAALEGRLAAPAPIPAQATSAAPPAAAAPGLATVAAAGPVAASPPARPAAPPAPARPVDWEQQIAGRWLNRVGLLAVAIGMSYFLKYAIDNDWIGPTGQIAIGVLIGAALVGTGPWLIRRGYAYFADGLAGLGAAVLYLSAWAATSYYQLVPPTVGFAGMVAITAAMLAIAIGRSSQRVALLALLGGFLTPALVSTGRNAEIALFSYIAMLNAGLLPIAWLRRWRAIELPAFAFTVLYYAIWFGRYYDTPALAATTTFVLFFFAEFLTLPVLRARDGAPVRFDQTLLTILNPAVWLIAMHALLWPDHRWALTGVALALAAAHLVIVQAAPASTTDKPSSMRVLFGGIALVLVTIAVPIRLDGAWVGWAWAAESAMLVVIGLRVNVPYMRALGLTLLGLVSFGWLMDSAAPNVTREFLRNQRFGTAVVIVLSLIVVARAARLYRDRIGSAERPWYALAGILVNVIALTALTFEAHNYFVEHESGFVPTSARLGEGLTISLLWALAAMLLTAIGVRTQQAALRWQGLALFGIVAVKVFFYDLADLRGLYRIASAIVLGVLLLIVSFLYQRRAVAPRKEAGA